MNLQPGGRLDIFFIHGKAVTVTGANGVTQTVSRPGFAITVSAPGASPSPPYPAPPGAIDAVLVQVDGRPGGNGGAAQVPTDLTVTSSGIDGTISGDLATSIQSAEQNLAANSTLTVNNNTAGNTVSSLVSTNVTPPIIPVDCAVTPCAGVSSQTFFTTTTTTPPPPPPPSNVVINFAGNFRSTNGQGTARGFVDPNGVVSYAGGTLTFPPGMPQQGV